MRVTSAKLSKCDTIAHGFFTRQGGMSEGIYASLNCGPGSADDPAAVQENRRRVLKVLCHPEEDQVSPSRLREGLGEGVKHPHPTYPACGGGDSSHQKGIENGTLCSLYQIHSADVVTVSAPWEQAKPPKADAMVTNQPGIALGILTADCGPVLFCDPEARVIGAAHAGWKGAIGGVLENTIKAMETLGARRGNILAAIGPCIAQPSYEVGAEFYQRFVEEDALYGTFFIESGKPEHFHFNLPGFIAHQLAQSGLQHVESLAMDTYTDATRFFSYRRTTHAGEPDYGRQISAIRLT